MLDAEESVFERAWESETVEAETDVMCLTTSFTFIQALRFAISGVLPNDEGMDSEEDLEEIGKASISSGALWLMLAGTVFLVFVFAFSICVGSTDEEKDDAVEEVQELLDENDEENFVEEEKEDPSPLKKRLVTVVSLTAGMGFSWCYFFSTRWIFYGFSFVGRSEEDTAPDMELVSILTALTLSFCSFVAIILLDKLADADFTDSRVDDAIRQTISRMGILVGFAWEQCFSESVLSIAAQCGNPHISKMVLALFSVALVAPAWKFYLLPMAHHGGWQFGFVVDMSRLKVATQHINHKTVNDDKFRLDRKRSKKELSGDHKVKFSESMFQKLLTENEALKGKAARAHEESTQLSSSLNDHLGSMRIQVDRMKGSISKAEQQHPQVRTNVQ